MRQYVSITDDRLGIINGGIHSWQKFQSDRKWAFGSDRRTGAFMEHAKTHLDGRYRSSFVTSHIETFGKRAVAAAAAFIAGLIGLFGPALADKPEPWQMGLQAANAPIMRDIQWFHDFTLVIIVAIMVLVTVLLGYVMVRFRASANPNPSKVSHNTTVEILWTIVPIVILVIIAVPSFRLLYKQLEIPKADLTVKAIGNQWSWNYEYPDHGDLSFNQALLRDHADLPEAERKDADPANFREKLKPSEPRLLAVNHEVVVPVGKVIVMQVTANKVIHSWALPSFGVKVDAVPGRLNETWFRPERTGIYYGQCSELCGRGHAYMPIAVRVVTQEQFDAWVKTAQDDVDEANKQLSAAIEKARAVEVAKN